MIRAHILLLFDLIEIHGWPKLWHFHFCHISINFHFSTTLCRQFNCTTLFSSTLSVKNVSNFACLENLLHNSITNTNYTNHNLNYHQFAVNCYSQVSCPLAWNKTTSKNLCCSCSRISFLSLSAKCAIYTSINWRTGRYYVNKTTYPLHQGVGKLPDVSWWREFYLIQIQSCRF